MPLRRWHGRRPTQDVSGHVERSNWTRLARDIHCGLGERRHSLVPLINGKPAVMCFGLWPAADREKLDFYGGKVTHGSRP